MIDGSGELALGEKARPIVWSSKSLTQQFERHSSALFDVLGFVDFAHAAATDRTVDPIWAEGVAWLKAPIVGDIPMARVAG
jgi:hypothetical protein